MEGYVGQRTGHSVFIYHCLEGYGMCRRNEHIVEADGRAVFNGKIRIVVTHQRAHGAIGILNANRSRSAAEEARLNVIEGGDLRSTYLDHSSD